VVSRHIDVYHPEAPESNFYGHTSLSEAIRTAAQNCSRVVLTTKVDGPRINRNITYQRNVPYRVVWLAVSGPLITAGTPAVEEAPTNGSFLNGFCCQTAKRI